jgi:hypothetical protein
MPTPTNSTTRTWNQAPTQLTPATRGTGAARRTTSPAPQTCPQGLRGPGRNAGHHLGRRTRPGRPGRPGTTRGRPTGHGSAQTTRCRASAVRGHASLARAQGRLLPASSARPRRAAHARPARTARKGQRLARRDRRRVPTRRAWTGEPQAHPGRKIPVTADNSSIPDRITRARNSRARNMPRRITSGRGAAGRRMRRHPGGPLGLDGTASRPDIRPRPHRGRPSLPGALSTPEARTPAAGVAPSRSEAGRKPTDRRRRRTAPPRRHSASRGSLSLDRASPGPAGRGSLIQIPGLELAVRRRPGRRPPDSARLSSRPGMRDQDRSRPGRGWVRAATRRSDRNRRRPASSIRERVSSRTAATRTPGILTERDSPPLDGPLPARPALVPTAPGAMLAPIMLGPIVLALTVRAPTHRVLLTAALTVPPLTVPPLTVLPLTVPAPTRRDRTARAAGRARGHRVRGHRVRARMDPPSMMRAHTVRMAVPTRTGRLSPTVSSAGSRGTPDRGRRRVHSTEPAGRLAGTGTARTEAARTEAARTEAARTGTATARPAGAAGTPARGRPRGRARDRAGRPSRHPQVPVLAPACGCLAAGRPTAAGQVPTRGTPARGKPQDPARTRARGRARSAVAAETPVPGRPQVPRKAPAGHPARDSSARDSRARDSRARDSSARASGTLVPGRRPELHQDPAAARAGPVPVRNPPPVRPTPVRRTPAVTSRRVSSTRVHPQARATPAASAGSAAR